MTPKPFIPSTRILRYLSARYPQTCGCPHRLTYRQLTSNTPSREKQHLTPELSHSRRRDGELQPRPLSRPLGLPHPPRPFENTGRDARTLSQKRDDFADYGKHRQRRQQLLTDVMEKNYFRDVGNLGKVWKGKSILSPATPFKKEIALYFPNLEGMTLNGRGVGWGKVWGQTTDALRGKVSVVTLVHTTWAEAQVKSFVSREENAAIREAVDNAKGAQFVTVNVEENPLKAMMVRLFWGRVRRRTKKQDWGNYFLNRRGLTEDIRDALAMWNSKVGYVYLVDGDCRIRWAGNGYAQPQEKESLVRCVKRLVQEIQPAVHRQELYTARH